HAASRPAPNHREIADGLSLIDVIESLQPPVRRSEMAILAALSASYRIARGECRKARLRLTWLKRQSWLRELPTRIGSVSRTRLVGLFVGDSRCGRERGALRQLVRGAIR
ncbi:MAG: hypothetical protein KC609_20275, partial [Myxococcales bacterium]|nr:hypothetical protein [Myxococcales bacterium]